MQNTLFPQVSPAEVNHLQSELSSSYQVPHPYVDESLQQKRPKVAAYCRVSTLSDMQEDSLENQTIHFTNFIRSNPDWSFAGVYSDRGKSGTQTQSRYGFNKMIRQALDGKIDIILCKSLSRMARNVSDTLDTVRLLKEKGVRVIFESEGIDTGDMQSEFILTMLSAVVQEESRSISENNTWAFRKRCERGDVRFNRMLGYTSTEERDWVIVEEEAKMVQEAFDEFLKGTGLSRIARKFLIKGHKKVNGKTDWSGISIKGILTNERYTGDVLCQKRYTKDHLSHKVVVNNGERNQYLISDHHEPIIRRHIFDEVQALFSKNNKNNKKKSKGRWKSYPFSGRLVCARCGRNFVRSANGDVVTWRCGSRSKNILLCSMKGIKEEKFKQPLVQAFIERYQIDYSNHSTSQITRLIKELQSAASSREFEQNRFRLDLERALLEENTAILKSSEVSHLTEKRLAVEERMAERESWWEMVDRDYIYRKEALDVLTNLKLVGDPVKQLRQQMENLSFLRAWAVRIEAVSPYLFSITWVSGDKTEIDLTKGVI